MAQGYASDVRAASRGQSLESGSGKHNGATLSLVFDDQLETPFNCTLTFTARSTKISGSGVRGSITLK